MDLTKRQITKIAREATRFAVRSLKAEGIGTAELDFIHVVRHAPGITQAGVRKLLNLDKAAAARREAALEAKGYLIRRADPDDGRCQQLFATEKAEQFKNSKTSVETLFYAWLLEELPVSEQQAFAATLNKLYNRSKEERVAGFSTLNERLTEKEAAE